MKQVLVISRRILSRQWHIKRKQILRFAAPLAFMAIFLLRFPDPTGSGVTGQAANPCQASSGSITRVTITSTVYAKQIPASVYLPPCYESSTAPLPVIYLLHGANTDETQWPDLRVQPEADTLIANGAPPFVVVMPGGEYLTGLDYAAFVLDDVLPAMHDQLNIRADAAGQAIGGISMGGYWALSIALHHPDQFEAVGGYSPVVGYGSDDLVAFARKGAGLDRLRVQLDVGYADPLAAGARQLADALQARGLDVSFTINPGGHNRPYWRSHTGDYLRFMLATNFTPSPPTSRCHSGS